MVIVPLTKYLSALDHANWLRNITYTEIEIENMAHQENSNKSTINRLSSTHCMLGHEIMGREFGYKHYEDHFVPAKAPVSE